MTSKLLEQQHLTLEGHCNGFHATIAEIATRESKTYTKELWLVSIKGTQSSVTAIMAGLAKKQTSPLEVRPSFTIEEEDNNPRPMNMTVRRPEQSGTWKMIKQPLAKGNGACLLYTSPSPRD